MEIPKNDISDDVFQDIWKMTNLIPEHKKQFKTVVKDHISIRFSPIFVKELERVLYNSIFCHFHFNYLLIK